MVITIITLSGKQSPPFLLVACDLLLTVNLPLAAGGPCALCPKSLGCGWGWIGGSCADVRS